MDDNRSDADGQGFLQEALLARLEGRPFEPPQPEPTMEVIVPLFVGVDLVLTRTNEGYGNVEVQRAWSLAPGRRIAAMEEREKAISATPPDDAPAPVAG